MLLHPLDPLSAKEISKTSDVLRKDKKLRHYKDFRFISITLIEPTKEDVFEYEISGEKAKKIDRRANVVLSVNDDVSLWEIDVNLTKEHVERWTQAKSGQPSVNNEEFGQIETAIKNSPLVLEALKKRGIQSTENLVIDPWPCGKFNFDYEAGGLRRRVMSLLFVKMNDGDFFYAHPIDGLVPIIDLHTMQVVHLEDQWAESPGGPLPIPEKRFSCEPKSQPGLKPVLLTQPEGPSFQVHGNHLTWADWSLRIGFTAREGLVLHNVKYEGRSVLFRASLSEMLVPYGDPAPGQFRKNAFDMGEYGVGKGANSLKNGCDCFGNIRYFDAFISDAFGNAYKIQNAVCLHEEDAGILYKHTDWHTNDVMTKRNRKLVLSFIASLANYDYAFYWYFYLDGAIEAEIKLTGVVTVGALRNKSDTKYGTVLGPNLYAPIHEHFFCYRLDFALDGVKNSALRVDVKAEADSSKNPYKGAYYAENTLLKRDVEAQGVVNSRTSTYWKIINPNMKNELGQPVGYRLIPGTNIFPYAQDDSSVMKRGGFVKKHFWVTPYNSDQYFAGGKFVMQNDDGNTLEKWAKQGQSVENTDIVVWYTLGIMHVVRPEDFPIMPCGSIGFKMQPDGFFGQNPMIVKS